MTTRTTRLERDKAIQATLRDISKCNRRRVHYRIGSYEHRLAECLLVINKEVLAWQREWDGQRIGE